MNDVLAKCLNGKLDVVDSISRWKLWIFIFVFVISITLTDGHRSIHPSDDLHQEYACFNTIFEISCYPGEILLFETARYGRNDSLGSVRCDMPFTRSCDVDVQYPMSRACGGRRKCSIAVNTAFFGDPCGYEEFLKVTYRCLPNSIIHRRCPDSSSYRFLSHGYLASPNYPGKYYPDGDCHWALEVQPQQTLRLTLYDFELDVKRGGTCHDFLDVTSGNRTYFRDCGTLGKQVIEVDANRVTIWFRTGQTSLTQRGFIIYLEAVGEGCQLISDLQGSTSGSLRVVYHLDSEGLVANVTCDVDHEFSDVVGEPVTPRVLRCQNESWSMDLPRCLPSIKMTTVNALSVYNSTSTSEEFPAYLFSIIVGVVSSALFIMLIIIIFAICCNRRRRLADRKRDEWRVVVNNLQDNAINDVTKALQLRDDFLQFPAKTSHACAKRHNNKRCTADAWPNRNLLCPSRDFYVESDERTPPRQTTVVDVAGISGPFIRCAICWAEQNETGDVGGYVGLVPQSPSTRDIMMGLGRSRTRALSEPLIGVCLDARAISAWYSVPDICSNISAR